MKRPLECIIEDFASEAIIPTDGGIPQYTTKEKYELFYKISKEEEQQAFDYIKKILVPIVVGMFNKQIELNVDTEDITSIEEIRRGLKKVISKPFYLYKGSKIDVIVWAFKKDQYTFIFQLRKWIPGLIVTSINPIFLTTRTYKVGSNPPLQTLSPPSIPELEKSLNLRENTEKINDGYKLTREEEQRGLQYIRNEVLPLAIEEYSLASRELHLPPVRLGPEEDQVIKSLRKIRHETFPNDRLDRAIYMAEFKGYKWIFMVEKIRGDVRAGYIDDLFNESKLFDIHFSVKDPKRPAARSSARRIKGYMPGGMGLISEVHSQGPYPTITPEEEKQAFQYIKRHIVPLFVKEYNSNSRDDTTNITDNDINQNLKKDSVYRWPDGNISMIYYTAIIQPSTYFIFMMRKGNGRKLQVGYNDPYSHSQQWFSIAGKILQEFKKLRELLKVERKPLL